MYVIFMYGCMCVILTNFYFLFIPQEIILEPVFP